MTKLNKWCLYRQDTYTWRPLYRDGMFDTQEDAQAFLNERKKKNNYYDSVHIMRVDTDELYIERFKNFKGGLKHE